jgi:hypothetical protein
MSLQKILEDARSGLIELSVKNPLLNYKQTKKRGILLNVKNIKLMTQ